MLSLKFGDPPYLFVHRAYISAPGGSHALEIEESRRRRGVSCDTRVYVCCCQATAKLHTEGVWMHAEILRHGDAGA